MTRLRGRAESGKRLVSAVPHGHWQTSTFIAGLRQDGLIAPGVFDGAINGAMFLAYVEQVLAPTLTAGDTVIMDNLGSHKVAGVREAIEAAGATLMYLPTYSPGSEPDRTGVCQAQGATACPSLADSRGTLGRTRHPRQILRRHRVRQLPPELRLFPVSVKVL
jgi:hypothetical protein